MRSKILRLTWVGIMVISSFVLGTFIGPKIIGNQAVAVRRPPPLTSLNGRIPMRLPVRRYPIPRQTVPRRRP